MKNDTENGISCNAMKHRKKIIIFSSDSLNTFISSLSFLLLFFKEKKKRKKTFEFQIQIENRNILLPFIIAIENVMQKIVFIL